VPRQAVASLPPCGAAPLPERLPPSACAPPLPLLRAGRVRLVRVPRPEQLLRSADALLFLRLQAGPVAQPRLWRVPRPAALARASLRLLRAGVALPERLPPPAGALPLPRLHAEHVLWPLPGGVPWPVARARVASRPRRVLLLCVSFLRRVRRACG